MTESYLLESLRRRPGGQPRPTQINVELTHDCNLRCRHCYLEHEHGRDELTLEQWQDVFDQIVAMDCYFVAMTGGEILCRDDFHEIVSYARDKGIFYHFQTNGTLVDEAEADRFRELNPTKVEISIYGADAAAHDRVTGVPGSFAAARSAIELLRRREMRVVVKSTVTRLNWKEVPAIRDMALALGAGFQADPVVMPGVHGSDKPVSYRMNDDELSQYMIREGWHLEPDDEVSQAIRELDTPERRMICSAAVSRCAISPEGDVYPCVLWRRKCGNVLEEKLADIWHGEAMQQCRRMELELLHHCKDCEMISTCVRCAALAYMEEGDELSRAPESCRMSKLLRGVKGNEEGIPRSED